MIEGNFASDVESRHMLQTGREVAVKRDATVDMEGSNGQWELTSGKNTINAAVLDLLKAFLAVAASAAITQRPAALLLGTVYFVHQDRQHPETPPAGLRPQRLVIMHFPNFLVGQVENSAAAIVVVSLKTIVNFPDLLTVEPRPVPTGAVGTDHSFLAGVETPEEDPEEDLEAVPEEDLEEVPEAIPEAVPEVDPEEVPEEVLDVVAVTAVVTEGPKVAKLQTVDHLNED